MLAPAFDTHKFVRKLKNVGFNEQQAEVLTHAVWESQASADIAKKQDIADLRRDVQQDIADLRKDLADAEERTDAKLEKLGTDLRHEIGDLRKDMDAKHGALRHEIGDLRKDNELLRKDMSEIEQRSDAKLDKLGLQIVNKLGGLIVGAVVVIAALPVLFKYLHVG